MQPVIRLSLVTAAAMVALALMATASAQAESTALCRFNKTPCEGIDLLKSQSFETLTSSPVVFLNKTLNVSCFSSLGTSIGALAAPQTSTITSLSWTKCTFGCTVTTKEPGQINYLRTGPNLATATFSKTTINLKCSVFIDCTVLIESTMSVTGANFTTNGTLQSKEGLLKKVSGNCPETGSFDALYEGNTAFYIGT